MGRSVVTGSAILCSALEAMGVEVAFGLPGSQSIELFDDLRRSSLRTILTVDERAATFMAQGYYRASGKIAVVMVISGPGFASALAGLAEARHDSAGLVLITVGTDHARDKQFRLQVIDQPAMADPVAKAVVTIDSAEDVAQKITQACQLAATGEPGPVVVQLNTAVLIAAAGESPVEKTNPVQNRSPADDQIAQLVASLMEAKRPVLYVGQGALRASKDIIRLAEVLGCPVLTTCSGRGVIPENHQLSFYFDYASSAGGETINQLIERADLVLALGCKFTHSGTGGFRLQIAEHQLVHVDASAEVLNANYPARLTIQADLPAMMDGLMADTNRFSHSIWSESELAEWHRRLNTEIDRIPHTEPTLENGDPVASFFLALAEILDENAYVTTDSGLHQVLTRRHLNVRRPGGLIVPTDFQSMGFGLPAAIGVKLAQTSTPVVALVGDGGLAMTAMELGTAAREEIPLTVIVFSDGKLGMIRLYQLRKSGEEHAVNLHVPDYRQLANALGVSYCRWEDLIDEQTPQPASLSTVRLIELRLTDSPAIQKLRRSGKRREAIRSLLGPRLTARLKTWLRQ